MSIDEINKLLGVMLSINNEMVKVVGQYSDEFAKYCKYCRQNHFLAQESRRKLETLFERELDLVASRESVVTKLEHMRDGL